MKVSIKKFSDGIKDRLDAMLSDGMDMRVLFSRSIYPKYQQAQIKRWRTRSASEDTTWESYKSSQLRPKSRETLLKRRRFKDYPYKGRKDLVATGRLLASIVGPSDKMKSLGHAPADHRKIIKRLRMEIATTVEYAEDVAERFDIMEFSDKTEQSWQREMERYLSGKHKLSRKPKKTKPKK